MIEKLKRGYTFCYDKTIWKVTQVYTIKWKDATSSIEYRIKSDKGQIAFLEIETDEKTNRKTYLFWEKEYDVDCEKGTTDTIKVDELEFDKEINHKSIAYTFNKKIKGKFRYNHTTEKVISLDYENEDNTKFLSIEVWEDEYEFSTGIIIESTDITQIEEPSSYFATIDSSSIISGLKQRIVPITFMMLFFLFFITRCSNSNEDGDNENSINRSSTNIIRSRNYGGYGK